MRPWRSGGGPQSYIKSTERGKVGLELDLATRRIRLHDVFRTYLRGEIGVEGISLLDSTLVEAYEKRCPNGWAAGPNDGYFFQYLLWHLAGAGRGQEVRSLLLDYAWIEAKVHALGIGPVLEDYESFARDLTVRTMGQTLRLSTHALAREPAGLLSQLFGRIDRYKDRELESLLIRAVHQRRATPWLCPRTCSLTRPGGALLQTLDGHTQSVRAVAVTPDGRRAISGSYDGTLKVWDLEVTVHTLDLAGRSKIWWVSGSSAVHVVV